MAWLLMTMLVLPVSGECCHEKEANRETKMPVFYVVRNHFRLYFVFVSVDEIISFSVSISINEYITAGSVLFICVLLLCRQWLIVAHASCCSMK